MVWNTWFVTGADSPLGIEIVRQGLAKGHHVVATDSGSTTVMRSFGNVSEGRLLTLPLDETDAGQVASAFGAAVERFGGIDVLVHGAALCRPKSAYALSPQRQPLSSSVRSLFNVTRAAIAAMRGQCAGRIHHLLPAPNAGLEQFPFSIAGFCRAVAADVAPLGIEVSAVTLHEVLRLLCTTSEHEPNQLQRRVRRDRHRSPCMQCTKAQRTRDQLRFPAKV